MEIKGDDKNIFTTFKNNFATYVHTDIHEPLKMEIYYKVGIRYHKTNVPKFLFSIHSQTNLALFISVQKTSIGLSDGSGIKKRNFAVIKYCLRFEAHAVWYDLMFACLTLTLTMLNNEKKYEYLIGLPITIFLETLKP